MATFIQSLIALRKVTKTFRLEATPPGPIFGTKFGGAPFWPTGVARPKCRAGHAMDFVIQVALADVPGLAEDDCGLVSFHCCPTCYDALGGTDATDAFSDVRVIQRAEQFVPDGLPPTEGTLPAQACHFTAHEEIMAQEDVWDGRVEYDEELEADEDDEFDPNEYPISSEEFERAGVPDFSNRSGNKLGGWPSWQQASGWLDCPHGRPYLFVAQLRASLLPNGPWAGGGAGYLWACSADCEERTGTLSFQVT